MTANTAAPLLAQQHDRQHSSIAADSVACVLEPECFTGAEFFVTDEAYDSKQLPRIEGKDETGSPQESEVNRPQEGEDHRPQEGEVNRPQDGEDHHAQGDEDHHPQDGDCE